MSMIPARRPTWLQMHAYVQQVIKLGQAKQTQPIHKLLQHSTEFLTRLLPPRLQAYHQSNHYNHYNRNITSLPSFEALSKCFHRYSNQNEWQKAKSGYSGSAEDQTRAFGQFLSNQMIDMEQAVQTVTHECRDLMQSVKSNSQTTVVQSTQSEINQMLNESYAMLIEMRIHSSHYAFGLDVFESVQAEKNEDAADIAQEYPVACLVNVSQMARSAAESARAAAIEKFGDCVELQVTHLQGNNAADDDVMMIGCASHIHFMLLEAIKNAVKAEMELHGVLHLHDTEPVKIIVSGENERRGKLIGVIVQDSGVGLSGLNSEFNQSPNPSSLFDYFASTTASAEATNNWRYSRSFGNPFSGLGVGSNMSRLYAEAYGGGASISWVPGLTQCFFVFNAQGLAPIGRPMTLMR